MDKCEVDLHRKASDIIKLKHITGQATKVEIGFIIIVLRTLYTGILDGQGL